MKSDGARTTPNHAHDVADSQPVTAGQIVLTAAFFALLTGLGEVVILVLLKFGLDQYIHEGVQLAWMAPVAQLLLFTPPTLLLLLGRWLRPGAVTLSVVVGVFVFLSVVSLMVVHQKVHFAAIVVFGLGLAAWTGRKAASHGAMFRQVRRGTVALAGLVVLIAAAVEGGLLVRERSELARLPAATAGTPNILLIILDTVRAFNLSVYGYARPTTPNLERLAQRGVVFDWAMTTAPWTLPSHASMFTGRWPRELWPPDQLAAGRKRERPLTAKVPTIAEVLRENGYLTAGFISNNNLVSRESGLTRGFIHYEDFDHSLEQFVASSALVRKVTTKRWFRDGFRFRRILGRKNAGRIGDDFLDWLPSDGKRPFFAFLNYMDAHAPYLPPPPFDTIFHRGVRKRRPPLSQEWNVSAQAKDIAEVEVAAYDGSIAYLDSELGRLFEELSRRGVMENTVVIISSDHGEELGDRLDFGHGHTMHMELLRVPLIITPPAKEITRRRVSSPVSIRNLPSTLVDLTGARTSAAFPGRSLSRHWRSVGAAEVEPADTVVTQLRDKTSVFLERFHFFYDARNREHLYDFRSDPLERENLADDPGHQAVLDSLKAFADGIAPRTSLRRSN
ncbi:MAG: sulfatase [Gemmatimonadaceae bacterium]